MPMAIPAIAAVGALASAGAGIAQATKQTPLDSSIKSNSNLKFSSPPTGVVGSDLPTQPLQASLGGGNLPGNVQSGSYALPRNNGLYQGAQNLDLISALQGNK